MSNKNEALDNIRKACTSLELARNALSEELLAHADDREKRGSEHADLQELHRRVSQAIALLPHGGKTR